MLAAFQERSTDIQMSLRWMTDVSPMERSKKGYG